MELQDIAVWIGDRGGGRSRSHSWHSAGAGLTAAPASGDRPAGPIGGPAGRFAQNALSERLQAQERALAAKLDERLNSLQDRVGLRPCNPMPSRPARRMTELRERLAVIDAAQKNITPNCRARWWTCRTCSRNKQARGAFGEVQLQDIVQSSPASAELRVPGAAGRQTGRLPADPAEPAGLRSASTPSSRWNPIARCARPGMTIGDRRRRGATSPWRSACTSRRSRRNTSYRARPPIPP